MRKVPITLSTTMRKVPTTAEVVAVLRDNHDLCVMGTISEPDGDPWGDLDSCRMMTQYGFRDSELPIVELLTTWRKGEDRLDRVNEVTEYYLWYPTADYDQE